MGAGQPKALVPQDIRGLRQQQIGYLQDPQSFLKLLGGLGSPQSTLQMQGADALGGMLRQPTPEQRALDVSMPALQGMLTGTGPQFESDIASANQQGGRFGSGNDILRGQALLHLFNLRNQTANTLGLLSQGAGSANRGLAGQAFATGTQQAGQADIETQRRLEVLMQLLGVGQQTAFNVPIQQNPGLFQQLLGAVPLLGGIFGGHSPTPTATGGATVNPSAFSPSNFAPTGYGYNR